MRSLKPFQFSYYDYIADNSLVALNPHQPNLHFIVFMLNQSFNQKKKYDGIRKMEKVQYRGLGCEVLSEIRVSGPFIKEYRVTTQTSVAHMGKRYITTKT